MLRRLWLSFVRLLTGQGEHERLGRLLHLLRVNGVTSYQDGRIKLQLEALAPADQGGMPVSNVPSDAELLFGESEASLRSQGLL